MSGHVKVPGPSVVGLWSLFWRAVVLTPLAAIFGVVLLAAWCGLLAFPVFIVLSLFLDRWMQAVVFLILWLVSCLLTRSKWFRVDSKEVLNDQENI